MKISVIGTGLTRFGELWNKSIYDLAQEAIKAALQNSKIDPEKIDAVYVANMLSGNLLGQNHMGPVITSMLGRNIPAFAIEAACASGGTATHLAVQTLLAGTYKNVLVVGVEKMTDDTTAEVTTGLMGAASEEERQAGLTFPGLYAMLANAHMQKYKTTNKQLALVAVKNHFNGSLNPNAQFQNKITVEKVLGSTMVANPLTLFDCSPITDGAAAIVLSTEDTHNNPSITGSAVATDHISISKRHSMTELLATKLSAQKAYSQAGISAKDINVAEVHDCFTIAEILAYEDLGFCPKGLGGKLISSGAVELGGNIPVNTSGGLKACGHPVGATGIKQIIEIADQLMGKAQKRQIKNAKIGLTHNVGGSGATAAVHILQI
jgi:acetyl-CoA C-acetyltransferase